MRRQYLAQSSFAHKELYAELVMRTNHGVFRYIIFIALISKLLMYINVQIINVHKVNL